ncbi:MAG TPA: hypothetical protein VEQ85_04670 [Lacipirellulaceae bacterium]|nr:hypothetical protein [Lacipirellulaceae bacterium]
MNSPCTRRLGAFGITRSALTAGLMAIVAAQPAAAAFASGHPPAGHGEEAPAAAPERTDLLDLGKFRIRGCRASDREIFDVQFAVQLVLSSQATAEDYQHLADWKNRLRDQVIIAVRSLELTDYADPELRKLQRLVLFRVKRLDTSAPIIGMYLTDFTLDEGETMADLMTPPVTPAPPKKPAASGGH